jgi:hypothetical protein
LVAEVQSLRSGRDTSHHIDKAQELLTRWWSTATWRAREKLLKAAGWLIQLEKKNDARLLSPL